MPRWLKRGNQKTALVEKEIWSIVEKLASIEDGYTKEVRREIQRNDYHEKVVE